jgi:hypothetical protein
MGERKGANKIWWRDLRKGDHLEDPDVDGRLILKWIFKKRDGRVMDWIDRAQDTDRWRALVSAVMNLRVPQNARSFLICWEAVSFSRTTVRVVKLVS